MGFAGSWAYRHATRSDPSVSTAAPAAENDDPRLTYQTPFLNVKPGVAYVGDAGTAPRAIRKSPRLTRIMAWAGCFAPIEAATASERMMPKHTTRWLSATCVFCGA